MQTDAFEAYVRRASPRLLMSARLLLGQDARDAEDLVQESLVRLYPRMRSIRDPHAIDAYVHRTMVRLAQRTWRRRAHPTVPLTEPMEPVQPKIGFDPAVLDAVRRLPPGQRQTVVLRYVLDLSVNDTASAMDCSAGNVKAQSAKALTTLRRSLSADFLVPTPERSSHDPH